MTQVNILENCGEVPMLYYIILLLPNIKMYA